MSVKSSSFKKSNACVTKRNNAGITAKTRLTRGADEAIIASDIIKAFLSGEYDYGKKENLVQDISDSYTITNDIEETQDLFAEQLAGQIDRLCRGLRSRKDSCVVIETPINIDISNYVTTQFEDCDDIDVTDLQYIFDEVASISGENYLEGVCIKKGAPWLSTTRAGSKNPKNEIPMYLMIRALRKYADENFDEGEVVNLTASYWFLKKSSDTTKSTYFDPFFCQTGSSIRSLTERYVVGQKNDGNNAGSSLDDTFKPIIDAWVTGIDKDNMDQKKDCSGCINEPLCNYQPAPELVEDEESTVKVRKAITLNEEQQKIVDTREGVNICVAPPGSGKTETAIKERTIQMVLEEVEKMVERYESGEDIETTTSEVSNWTHVSDRTWE